MGDLNELVERFASIAAAEPDHNYHRSVMSVYGELPKGQLYVDAGALSAALTSLIAERDEAETSHKAARENFLTMQGAAAQLLKRALAAEAQLKAAREHIDRFSQINCQDAQAIADAQIAALSLDTNKGEGV